MAVEQRWALVLATLAACFILTLSVESSGAPVYSGCPLIAHSSEDLQDYLNSSLEPDCDTLTLKAQAYTLLPFDLSGAGTARTIVGLSQSESIYSIIMYNSSSDLSRVFDGARLKLSKMVVSATESIGGFLHVFGSGSQLTLDDVQILKFHTTDSAVIEANEDTKILLERAVFTNNFCQVVPTNPKSCQRGVLYIGQSGKASGEPNASSVHYAELNDVIFNSFQIASDGSQNDFFGGLVLTSSGTINVRTTYVSFNMNEGIALFADGGTTSKGRVNISPTYGSGGWTFEGNSFARVCAHLANTESLGISWSFERSRVKEHAFGIENSVIWAGSIDLMTTVPVNSSSRIASMAVSNSSIYSNSILMEGETSLPSSTAGLRSRGSTIVARNILAKFHDPGLHFLPIPQRSSILNVSTSMRIENNAGGIIVEFTSSNPKPIFINVGELEITSNGQWPERSYYTTTGGISMINSPTGNLEGVNLLEITAETILFKDNKALRGGAISYTAPFSLNSPSISFDGNIASVGGVYYSQDPSFKEFIPNELFQTTTYYSSNSAVQGCIIGFADRCAAFRHFDADFSDNNNESYRFPVPAKDDCSVSDQYCSPPPRECGDVPSFGLRYMWKYNLGCLLHYMDDLELPAGTTINRKFEVEGVLTFENPQHPSTATYSLYMQEPAMIVTNKPLVLPRLPIAYTVLNATGKLVIFQSTNITTSNRTRVDFFVTAANKGQQFVCDEHISSPLDPQTEFGFKGCRMEKVDAPSPAPTPTVSNPTSPSHKSNKNKMIVIIATSIAAGIAVSVSAAILIFCIVKNRATAVKQQYQPLPSDAEY